MSAQVLRGAHREVLAFIALGVVSAVGLLAWAGFFDGIGVRQQNTPQPVAETGPAGAAAPLPALGQLPSSHPGQQVHQQGGDRGRGWLARSALYRFTLTFPSAEGLRPGAAVRLNGVTAGHVTAVRVDLCAVSLTRT
jgi:hypothetical protein